MAADNSAVGACTQATIDAHRQWVNYDGDDVAAIVLQTVAHDGVRDGDYDASADKDEAARRVI